MSVLPVNFKCDNCGVLHTSLEESRGWYELHFDKDDTPGSRYRPPSLLIQTFSRSEALGVSHYCGERCLQMGIDRKLNLLRPMETETPSPSELHKASGTIAGEIVEAAQPPVEQESAASQCKCDSYSGSLDPSCEVHNYDYGY